jgi:hypothetical protein
LDRIAGALEGIDIRLRGLANGMPADTASSDRSRHPAEIRAQLHELALRIARIEEAMPWPVDSGGAFVPPVHRRMADSEGIVRGLTVDVDPSKLGNQAYMVELAMRNAIGDNAREALSGVLTLLRHLQAQCPKDDE